MSIFSLKNVSVSPSFQKCKYVIITKSLSLSLFVELLIIIIIRVCTSRSTPVAQSAPRNLLTRWDVSSIPANGIFLTKNKKKTTKKMPNGWRTVNSLVHKIRLHGRRGKGMAESFSRQKSRHAPQKEGGLKILCDLPPV